MTVRVVREEFDDFVEEPVEVEAGPSEAQPSEARSLPTALPRETVLIQATAVLTALAAVVSARLVIIVAVLSAAGLTAYAQMLHTLLSTVCAGMFDALTLTLAFVREDWRR